MNGIPTALQTVMISASVTLVVGILSVAGAYLLERFRRRSTDRRWLLDQRHTAYVAYMGRVNDLQRTVVKFRRFEPSEAEQERDHMATVEQQFAAVQDAWYSVILVGSDRAQAPAAELMEAVARQPLAESEESHAQAFEAARRAEAMLVALLRDEIQPPSRRWLQKQPAVVSGVPPAESGATVTAGRTQR